MKSKYAQVACERDKDVASTEVYRSEFCWRIYDKPSLFDLCSSRNTFLDRASRMDMLRAFLMTRRSAQLHRIEVSCVVFAHLRHRHHCCGTH